MTSLSKKPASQQSIASHLFISKTRVRQLVSEGVIAEGATLDEAREAYLGFLRVAATRRGDNSAEARRLAEAKARAIELKIARDEGELVPTEEAVALTALLVSEFVTRLDALPARVSRDLTIRRRIEEELDAIREAMADRCADLEEQYAQLGGA